MLVESYETITDSNEVLSLKAFSIIEVSELI